MLFFSSVRVGEQKKNKSGLISLASSKLTLSLQQAIDLFFFTSASALRPHATMNALAQRASLRVGAPASVSSATSGCERGVRRLEGAPGSATLSSSSF